MISICRLVKYFVSYYRDEKTYIAFFQHKLFLCTHGLRGSELETKTSLLQKIDVKHLLDSRSQQASALI